MLTVNRHYHLTHMAKDLEATSKLYKDIFQCDITPPGYHAAENRDASFTYVSDVYIELFAPRDASQPDPKSNGGRHIKKWGESLANFGWLIDDDIPGAIKFCESKGYNLVYVAGGQSAFFIHPRQAYGVMLEVGHAGPRTGDPRLEPGWAAHWRDKHPLGIERMNCVSYAVRDLEGAVGVVQSVVDAPMFYRGVDERTGKESAYLRISDHVIEVMQGISDNSEIGRFVQENGPKIHSVTFKVKDLKQAADYLRSKGLRLLGREDSGYITIDPEDMLGADYTFTDRAIPNDPRGA